MHDAVNLLFGNGGNYIVTKSRNLSTPLKSQHCQYKVSLVLAHDIICFVTYHVNLTIKCICFNVKCTHDLQNWQN